MRGCYMNDNKNIPQLSRKFGEFPIECSEIVGVDRRFAALLMCEFGVRYEYMHVMRITNPVSFFYSPHTCFDRRIQKHKDIGNRELSHGILSDCGISVIVYNMKKK